MSTKIIACVLALLVSRMACAWPITWYCKDDVSGVVSEVTKPTKGCYRTGGYLIVDDKDLADEEAFNLKAMMQSMEQRAAAHDRAVRAVAKLTKTHPKACEKFEKHVFCTPAPGMQISILQDAVELDPVGYHVDASGRVDRYRYKDCVVIAKNGRVVSLTC